MKKFTRFAAILVAISLILAIPVNAQNNAETRESAFFAAYGTTLEKTSATSFKIWFDVDANASTMQVLGVKEIDVYRSADQQTWTKVKTYHMDDYPQMVDYNTGSYAGYVTFSYATPAYYYTADVTFYAKNSTGIGERYVYTQILRMW